MFMQVLYGPIGDRDGLEAAGDRWRAELAPGAEGWVSSTEGTTSEGLFLVAVQFESRAAAERNSARPEQDAWWADTQRHFAGEVTFANFDDVQSERAGVTAEAGFVQVMLGELNDYGREQAAEYQSMSMPADFRPDLLGSVMGYDADAGRFVQVIYFTSEAEARIAEKQEPPAEMKDMMEEMGKSVAGIRYIDLTQPRIDIA